jgi:hypothetical protein
MTAFAVIAKVIFSAAFDVVFNAVLKTSAISISKSTSKAA